MLWLKSLNLYAMGALFILGAAAVSGIYLKGARDEQRKWALEMAERNKPILEQRGKDEAEVPANDAAGEHTAAVVAGAVKQECVLTPETVRLFAGIR